MNYEETLDYLYERTPAFHRIGSSAYKPGLERSMVLDDMSGNPHKRYKTIHIAGTNGKGSVAHLLAAVLQAAGHKVGLYTSPHLLDFSERIRINGRPITEQYVVDFVGKNIKFIEREKPSFFELTSAMAFDYFRHKKVNYAIIETGLGGRLDSTNIIKPILSIITSISLEHTQYLGNTLLDIANEKAGIIKRNIPVIIGEMYDDELKQFFSSKAFEVSSPVSFATQKETLLDAEMQPDGSWIFDSVDYGILTGELRGPSQKINAQTVLSALKVLSNSGAQIRIAAVRKAFKNVIQMTRLMGRWQELQAKPKVVCDIGHNVGAWEMNLRQLFFESSQHNHTHIILGMSNDKDVEGVLSLMPKKATYYFTQASGDRATPVEDIAQKGEAQGLNGQIFRTVKDAVKEALKSASENDFIFIGGSTFIVAEAIPLFPKTDKK
jgi:dihydrofolate synthase/folylpolyglutamate synthase